MLPSATKKAKSAEMPLFGAKTAWGASSTSLLPATSSSNADSSNSSSSVASSASNVIVSPQSLKPKTVFGFAAPKPGQTLPVRKPAVSPSKPIAAPSAPLASKSTLAKPTIESELPARFVAEGMSVEQALEKVVRSNLQAGSKTSDKPLLVLDTANISHEHGKGDWSTRGLPIAVKHYTALGYEVVAFLPEHYLTQHYPDPLQDWTPLEKLAKNKILITTPAADYDDLYMVQYARNNGGIIVSNDCYRDVPQSFQEPSERTAVAEWIKRHRIGFKFEGDKFLPRIYVDKVGKAPAHQKKK